MGNPSGNQVILVIMTSHCRQRISPVLISKLHLYIVILMCLEPVFQSKLEFKLRLQEFIELVREERMMEAVTYARKYLASWGSTNMKELQQAMATLAFKSSTDCASYKVSNFFVALTVH